MRRFIATRLVTLLGSTDALYAHLEHQNTLVDGIETQHDTCLPFAVNCFSRRHRLNRFSEPVANLQ